MIELNLRTKQRYQSLKQAVVKLDNVINMKENVDIEDVIRDSLIQRFEFCLELCWNLQKDIATDLGFVEIIGPKPAIEKAYEIGLIKNFELWKKMLKSRNLTSHTYDENQAIETV